MTLAMGDSPHPEPSPDGSGEVRATTLWKSAFMDIPTANARNANSLALQQDIDTPATSQDAAMPDNTVRIKQHLHWRAVVFRNKAADSNYRHPFEVPLR